MPSETTAGAPAGRRRYACIVHDRIDTQRILDGIKHPEDGAVVAFEGIVRNHTRGRRTLYLDYESYEGMAAKQMQQLAVSLGSLVSQFASRITKLVSDGQALIAGAATSLTNPKVITHLGLVKDGLTDSVKVIKSSGELIVKLAGYLAGFGS